MRSAVKDFLHHQPDPRWSGRRVLVGLLLLGGLLLAACQAPRGAAGRIDPAANSVDRLAALRAADRIRIGVRQDAPPFARRIGDLFVGFDVDIAQAVAAELGIEQVDFVGVSSDERLPAITEGRVDLLVASTTITRSRDAEIDFSQPYFEDGQRLLVAADSPIRSYRDCAGRRIAALRGTTSLANMAVVAPQATLVAMADYEEAVAALQAGRVDALTSDGLILAGLANTHGGGLQVVGEHFSSEAYGIGLPEDESDLRDAVNGALQDLWNDGVYQVIRGTWFGQGSAYADVPPFAMSVYGD